VKDAVIRIIAAAKKAAVCVSRERGGSQGFAGLAPAPSSSRRTGRCAARKPSPISKPPANHGWLTCIIALIPAPRSPPPGWRVPAATHFAGAEMRNSTKHRRRRIRTVRALGTPAARISSSPIATLTRARG
jgi:hypothetical protein